MASFGSLGISFVKNFSGTCEFVICSLFRLGPNETSPLQQLFY